MSEVTEQVFNELDKLPGVALTPYDVGGTQYVLDFPNGEALLVTAESYPSLSESLDAEVSMMIGDARL